MFKINIRLRFLLMAVSLVAGIALQIWLGFGFSFIFWLALIILTVTYFLFGTIASTGEFLSKQNFEAAEKQLAYTYKPEWLLKMYRGYYYQLKGFLALQKQDFDEGEKNLLIAKNMGLPTDNETATVLLQLGNISYNKRKVTQAKAYLREIKNLNVTEPLITKQVKQLELALKVKPSMGSMMMMQGRGMKGAKAKMARAQHAMMRKQQRQQGMMFNTKPRGGKKGRKKK